MRSNRESGATVRLRWGEVIGFPVTVGEVGSVGTEVLRLARSHSGGHVCVANVHMLTAARSDLHLRQVIEDAAIVVSDGMPLVWRLRRAGHADAQQVRGPDLTVHLCRRAAAEGVPVFFYGGDEALIAALVERLRREAPGLRIAGAEAAPLLPLRPEVDPALLERIRSSGAGLVFVGLGCPKQEFWMEAYRPHLDAVLLGVGQAFAIAAGRLAEAPAWMRRMGLEWLFRLVKEPRRLWRRYLTANSRFVALVVLEEIAWLLGRSGARRRPLGSP